MPEPDYVDPIVTANTTTPDMSIVDDPVDYPSSIISSGQQTSPVVSEDLRMDNASDIEDSDTVAKFKHLLDGYDYISVASSEESNDMDTNEVMVDKQTDDEDEEYEDRPATPDHLDVDISEAEEDEEDIVVISDDDSVIQEKVEDISVKEDDDEVHEVIDATEDSKELEEIENIEDEVVTIEADPIIVTQDIDPEVASPTFSRSPVPTTAPVVTPVPLRFSLPPVIPPTTTSSRTNRNVQRRTLVSRGG